MSQPQDIYEQNLTKFWKLINNGKIMFEKVKSHYECLKDILTDTIEISSKNKNITIKQLEERKLVFRNQIKITHSEHGFIKYYSDIVSHLGYEKQKSYCDKCNDRLVAFELDYHLLIQFDKIINYLIEINSYVIEI